MASLFFVHLFIVCALLVSFQGIAQASALPMSRPGDPTCRALRPECFPVGSPMWKELMIREGRISHEAFKVPDEKIPKLPGDQKGSASKKPFCAGSACPPSIPSIGFPAKQSENRRCTCTTKDCEMFCPPEF